jgi:hypothetical protein
VFFANTNEVVLKFLAKIDVETETVMDGVQCTDAVFSKSPGFYSIILVSPRAILVLLLC